ncbi:MAG: hypothetical protein O3A20_04870 [Planctomycetota bacterium]|nr:hypothetical protein [Planctomycetota bacterium]
MLISAILSLALAAAPAPQAPAVADDFNDGVLGSQWTAMFDPLQFWTVYEGLGYFNFEGLTAPFGANQEQFIIEAGLGSPIAGAFELNFRLVWEEISSLPPGSGVTLTHVVFLDSGLGEIARVGYEDVDEFGGGALVFTSPHGSASVPQAAAGDATVTVLRDGSGQLTFSAVGSGGSASGGFGLAAAPVAFLRLQVEHSTLCGPCGPFLEPTRFDWVEFGAPSGPILSKSGSCPGPITLDVNGATANGSVVILYGTAGSTTKPTGFCAGTTVAISNPQVGATLNANGSGTASLTVNLPAGACGRTVQGVDVGTCTPTNAIVL